MKSRGLAVVKICIVLIWVSVALMVLAIFTVPLLSTHFSRRMAEQVSNQCKNQDVCIDSIPKIEITTPNSTRVIKTVWETAEINIQDNLSKNQLDATSAKVKTRGSSTRTAGIKYGPMPYKINFEEEQNLLGMGKSKKWLLLPNFIDPSGIRQYLLFNASAAIMGDQYWTPQAKYVELYINQEYRGLYLLAESIEAEDNRVNISEAGFIVELEMQKKEPAFYKNPNRIKGNAFSIDQTVELDKRQEYGTDIGYLTFELHQPKTFDDLTEEQTNQITETIRKVYSQLENRVPLSEIAIDLDSFVRYFLFQEIFFNYEFGQSSVYLVNNGEITMAGPPWDFDRLASYWTTEGYLLPTIAKDRQQNPDAAYFSYENTLYRYLLAYPEFKEKIMQAFTDFYESSAPKLRDELMYLKENKTLCSAIEQNENLYHRLSRTDLEPAFQSNKHIESINTFEGQVDYLVGWLYDGLGFEHSEYTEWYQGRIEWIKEHLDEWGEV